MNSGSSRYSDARRLGGGSSGHGISDVLKSARQMVSDDLELNTSSAFTRLPQQQYSSQRKTVNSAPLVSKAGLGSHHHLTPLAQPGPPQLGGRNSSHSKKLNQESCDHYHEAEKIPQLATSVGTTPGVTPKELFSPPRAVDGNATTATSTATPIAGSGSTRTMKPLVEKNTPMSKSTSGAPAVKPTVKPVVTVSTPHKPATPPASWIPMIPSSNDDDSQKVEVAPSIISRSTAASVPPPKAPVEVAKPPVREEAESRPPITHVVLHSPAPKPRTVTPNEDVELDVTTTSVRVPFEGQQRKPTGAPKPLSASLLSSSATAVAQDPPQGPHTPQQIKGPPSSARPVAGPTLMKKRGSTLVLKSSAPPTTPSNAPPPPPPQYTIPEVPHVPPPQHLVAEEPGAGGPRLSPRQVMLAQQYGTQQQQQLGNSAASHSASANLAPGTQALVQNPSSGEVNFVGQGASVGSPQPSHHHYSSPPSLPYQQQHQQQRPDTANSILSQAESILLHGGAPKTVLDNHGNEVPHPSCALWSTVDLVPVTLTASIHEQFGRVTDWLGDTLGSMPPGGLGMSQAGSPPRKAMASTPQFKRVTARDDASSPSKPPPQQQHQQINQGGVPALNLKDRMTLAASGVDPASATSSSSAPGSPQSVGQHPTTATTTTGGMLLSHTQLPPTSPNGSGGAGSGGGGSARSPHAIGVGGGGGLMGVGSSPPHNVAAYSDTSSNVSSARRTIRPSSITFGEGITGTPFEGTLIAPPTPRPQQ